MTGKSSGGLNFSGENVKSTPQSRNISKNLVKATIKFDVNDDEILGPNPEKRFPARKVILNNDENDDEKNFIIPKRRFHEGKVEVDDDELKPALKKVKEIMVKIVDDDERDFKKKARIYFDDEVFPDSFGKESENKLKKVKIYQTDDEKIIKKLNDPSYNGPYIVNDDEDSSSFKRMHPGILRFYEKAPIISINHFILTISTIIRLSEGQAKES